MPAPTKTSQQATVGPNALEFLGSLWSVSHGMQSLSKRMNRKIGLTGPQRFVIRIIGQNPQIGSARLAELMHVDPSTLTGILKRLEKQRILRRQKVSGDARRAAFVLTIEGEKIARQRQGTIEAAVARALAKVGPRRAVEARAVLACIAAEIEQDL